MLRGSMIVAGIISVVVGFFLLTNAMNLLSTPPENAGKSDPDEQKLTGNDYEHAIIFSASILGGCILFFGGFYWIYLWVRDKD